MIKFKITSNKILKPHQAWRRNSELHREDGPALIYPSGAMYWYKNGEWV